MWHLSKIHLPYHTPNKHTQPTNIHHHHHPLPSPLHPPTLNRPFHTEIGKFGIFSAWTVAKRLLSLRAVLLGAFTTMTTPRMWHSIFMHSTRNCWCVEILLLFTMLKTTPALWWNDVSKVCFLSENFDMKSMYLENSFVCFFPNSLCPSIHVQIGTNLAWVSFSKVIGFKVSFLFYH